ncbi:UDP-3-O-(3-hydroxymyristoyl)glucosamine N-acyltransferase [Faecalibacter rhinopitheci]|uniref:UDP-3-O-acylglucosamine N-acyltransferase n=1 Tax=Faecalibacter rhinopitheci TaxID=2779678 RepID=A0A8J7KCE1_9FLAO|nr:UDP-3-O-(3-hydroxymyristoyl)glucosamine N-acyltransferase [Faecalibacter rhinopitheci]MBF0596101.1 UDP-3-O-(3-hydroxymyristoyl)glucosamine N-acyltransferase [Faecalibacter rhinopitheci]MBQ0147027.1 UDP-3-O-(3-hydroxymyristoyl)glucosamine N-acyltransferase [Candidatus Onthonaster equi]
MKFKAADIANLLNGVVKGDVNAEVWTLSKIEEGSEGSISFLANPKYEEYVYTTNSSVVIVNKSFEPSQPINTNLIVVEDAYKAFTVLLNHYNSVKNNKTGIEEFARISETATLGEDVYVGSFSYIGTNVKLGNNVKIYPNCTIGENVTIGDNTILRSGTQIYEDCVVGKDCIIHSNVVIGSDGFGFAPNTDGSYDKIPQIGNVIIEDNVEIGSGSTIDRATMGSTIIRKGAKLDNQIQIAHNVVIGENTVIASQAGIAGSAKVGRNCMIGGQAGLAGHIKIGDFVQIQGQSGINSDIKDGAQLYGSPAINATDYRKSYVYFRKFPSIVKRLDELENKINKTKS